MAVDWQTIILTPQWLDRLEGQSLKRFSQAGLAAEATTYVIDQLSENNWARCDQYTGKAKPETFLYTLTANLLEEFARKRFGRPRPPEWLKREGELWITIWKMVCLERQLIPTVIDHLCDNGNRSSSFVDGIIRTIQGRLPWCGHSNREIPSSMVCSYDDDGNQNEIEQSDNASPLEQQLEQQQLDDTLLLLSQLLDFMISPSKENNEIDDTLIMNNTQLDKLYHTLELTEEERLLLKMAYQEGMKMNAIAKALNMPTYQPGRLLKSLLQRIETAMTDANIPMDNIQVLLREEEE